MTHRPEATWIAWGIERAQAHANTTVPTEETE